MKAESGYYVRRSSLQRCREVSVVIEGQGPAEGGCLRKWVTGRWVALVAATCEC